MRKRFVAVLVSVLLLTGCSTADNADPTTASTSATVASDGTPSASASDQASATAPSDSMTVETSLPETSTVESSPAETSPTETSPAAPSQPEPATIESSSGAASPTSYAPPVDAEPTPGDCPYVTEDQVALATGDRVGSTQLRAASPQPVCEFLRGDDSFLLSVRVLQLATDADAVSAVDFYVPREQSDPQTRPTGWSGGQMRQGDLVVFAVSKGSYAIVVEANSEPPASRVIAEHAVEALGL